MNRKDIEKAASQSAFMETPDARERFLFSSGFRKGAEWRINSVWHDAKEQPTIDNVDIVIVHNSHIRSEFWCNFADWDKFVRTTKLEYWAYVKDLLPEEDEK